MSSRIIVPGSTDQSVVIRITDEAGLPVDSITSASSGLDLEYVRLGAAPTNITESDLASASAAHSDGGIYPLGKGNYRLDLPDAAVAAGVAAVEIQGSVTDYVVHGCTIQLLDLMDDDGVAAAVTTALTAFLAGVAVEVNPGSGDQSMGTMTLTPA